MIPDRFCDIVMKGGITSGVVYPRAVMALQRRYRFKSVGGTSAGAIAAAAAAAAEHDREGGGFDRLDQLPAFLGEGDNLSALFQAQAPLRGVFDLMLAVIAKRPGRIVGAALRHYWLAALIGATPGLSILLELDWSSSPYVAALWALVFALIGAVGVVVLWIAWRTSRALPACFYGICSGMPGPRSQRPALTPWLTDLLDTYAGRPTDGPPLTFGDLWRGRDGKGTAKDPALRLEMMTTNLTNRRAERLPWGTREFLFDPAEFARLFPQRVVDHMRAHPPPSDGERRPIEPAGLLPLPDPVDLPVIVATRMSLSFPVLLSAIPLWRVDYTRKMNQTPGPVTAERCWFSDGGISSNFPVHFFDAPLPRHPTFAINLRPYHPDRPPSQDQAENVWMAESASMPQSDWWYRFSEGADARYGFDLRIVQFLSGAIRTMQNRVDEQQMRVPGFRERVLHMSMSDDEGGMNLTMPPPVLNALLARGEAAGERMVRQFEVGDAPPDTVSWDAHRWVRLRSTLLATCEMLQRFAAGYDATPPPGAQTFEQLIDRPDDAPPLLYPMRSDARRALATQMSESINAIATALGGSPTSLEPGAPNPRPEARIVPKDMPPRADADA